MRTNFLASTTLAAAFAVASMPAGASCFTTVDLRPTAAQGGSDFVRLTNQGTNTSPLRFSVAYPSGTTLGEFFIDVNAGESVVETVASIFSQAGFGSLGYSIGSWPTRYITVTDLQAFDTPNYQGTVTNYQTKVVTPLLFTCRPVG